MSKMYLAYSAISALGHQLLTNRPLPNLFWSALTGTALRRARRTALHLLLGDSQDPWCLSVRIALEACNYPTRVIANPLAQPSRFAWLLNNEQSTSQLIWDEQPPLLTDDIAGVFVRSAAWIDPTGWQSADLAYMQAETQAALLAWLWSLACPVVNRYPSAIWYRPKTPLLCWQRLLRRCGLPTLKTLVTNVEDEAAAFRKRLALEGVPGSVYGPLNSDLRYLVADHNDWSGLAALQRRTPVCLTYPHGAAQFVCIAGEQTVWEGEPQSEITELEPALQCFASAAGLDFVEFALASTSQGTSVIAVEPYPYFEHFGEAARQKIVEGLVRFLTTQFDHRRQIPMQSLQGGFL